MPAGPRAHFVRTLARVLLHRTDSLSRPPSATRRRVADHRAGRQPRNARRVSEVGSFDRCCEAGEWRTRAYGLESAIEGRRVPDTRRLPFADEAFDVVVCSSVLQYVPDVIERSVLVAEMARLVRPCGLVVFCGSGNGLYLAGPHSSRWRSNWFPAKAARSGHNRGVTY